MQKNISPEKINSFWDSSIAILCELNEIFYVRYFEEHPRATDSINLFGRVLSFKIFEKIPVISLYWFVTPKRTSIFRRQKCDFSSSNFSVELIKLTSSLWKQLEQA